MLQKPGLNIYAAICNIQEFITVVLAGRPRGFPAVFVGVFTKRDMPGLATAADQVDNRQQDNGS